jgi:polysaccharide chain length determinant protein (PEP-CTERM system associated)
MEQEGRGGSMLDQVKAVWGRRKWLAVFTAAAAFTAAVSVVLFLPNLYTSTVTVLVDRHQIPEAFVKATVQSELEPRLHMVSQDIMSRARLLALIEQFNLYPNLRANKRASERDIVEQMRRDINVQLKSVERKGADAATTVAVAVTYRGPHPQTVSDVTNTLAGFYIEENRKTRERQASATSEVLKTQLQDTKARLDQQEAKLTVFRQRYPGALPQQAMGNLLSLERMQADLRLNSENYHRALERKQLLMTQPELAGVPGAIAADPERAHLARLKQELAQLRAQYSEKYPDVARTKAEIATLERQIANRPATPAATATGPAESPRTTGAIALVDAELRRLKAEEARLRDTIATYQRRVDEMPQREAEFQQMARDYETTRDLYKSLLARYEEATMGETMEQKNKGEVFRVVDPAVPADSPAAPKRLLLILIAGMLSLGLAAAVVVVAEQFDTSFHSVESLRSFTSVPLAVAVPRILTETDHVQYRRRASFAAAAALVALVLIMGAGYYFASGNFDLVAMLARRAA